MVGGVVKATGGEGMGGGEAGEWGEGDGTDHEKLMGKKKDK